MHPKFHGQGLGRKIFTHLLEEIKNHHPEIVRVELFVRSNNPKAIALYQKLGFEIEGYLKCRTSSSSGSLESDVIMAWINPEWTNPNLNFPA